jgi:hypothetical protein
LLQGRDSLLTGNRYHPCRGRGIQDRRYRRVRLNYHLEATLKLNDNLRIGTKLQEIGREWVRPQAPWRFELLPLTRLRERRLAANADVDGEFSSWLLAADKLTDRSQARYAQFQNLE